jgi:hypothetical protein
MTDVALILLSVPAPLVGEMLQVTPLFVGSLLTVAVNCCVLERSTVAETGDTETVMGVAAVCPPPHPKLSSAKARPTRTPTSDRQFLDLIATLL